MAFAGRVRPIAAVAAAMMLCSGAGGQATIDTHAGDGNTGYAGDGGPATAAQLDTPHGVAVARNGDVYIADSNNEVVRKVQKSTGIISHYAGGGSPSQIGDGAPALLAHHFEPSAVAVDGAGNVYIADQEHNRVRKVTVSTGTITTFAGTGTGGYSGDGGPATSAMIKKPGGIVVDSAGNVIFSDTENHRIRKITPGGTISTVAGNGSGGFEGDGGPATAAKLNKPRGLFIDAADVVYVADTSNDRIRKFTVGGTIETVVAKGGAGFEGDGGDALLAKLNTPYGVWVVSNGTPGDFGHQAIYGFSQATVARQQIATQVSLAQAATVNSITARLEGPNKKVRYAIYSDVAGEPDTLLVESDVVQMPNGPVWLTIGFPDTALAAGTYWLAMSLEDAAQAYVYDDAGGQTRTNANDAYDLGYLATWGASATSTSRRISMYASFNGPHIYIADQSNNRIRRATEGGAITTVAGEGGGGDTGDGGQATLAKLDTPEDVILNASGDLFIADNKNHKIRRVDGATGIISTYAGTGTAGSDGDGGPAAAALLENPTALFLDSAGDLFIADRLNHVVRKITTATGIIDRVSGVADLNFGPGDGGLAADAYLGVIEKMAIDADGNLYLACSDQSRIRRIDGTTGVITTAAGTGTAGYSGDGGYATLAMLKKPLGVAVDTSGNIYIADTENFRIRKVNTGGVITTIAGTGSGGYSGDGGAATFAQIKKCEDVEVDSAGNVYIVDRENKRIRRIDATSGIITTVAGNGSGGYEGDGGAATLARISNNSYGLAVDLAGNLYIADTDNHRIRKVTAATGIIDTVAGNGSAGYTGDGGLPTAAELDKPREVAMSGRDLMIVDSNNDVIRFVDNPSFKIVRWSEVAPDE